MVGREEEEEELHGGFTITVKIPTVVAEKVKLVTDFCHVITTLHPTHTLLNRVPTTTKRNNSLLST